MSAKSIQTLNWYSLFAHLILLTAGALISAFSIIVFFVPAGIATGGLTGAGIILNELFDTPIGILVLLGNIPIQILAYRMLGGWRSSASTAYYIVVYSLAIDVITPFMGDVEVSDNTLLLAIFGGIVGGIGGGLVYRAGATLGGTSTIARILQKQFGAPLSTTSLYADAVVIVSAGVVFGWEAALYAIVGLFVFGATSDYILEGPSVIRTATIITDHPEAVSHAIMDEMNRGVTAWQGEGMFTEKPHGVLFVTIGRPQVRTLQAIVFAVDPGAFVVIGQGQTAYGEGFKHVKKRLGAPV